MDKAKIYDRQPTDTDKSWLAFCKYRDMGNDRTLEKVRIECGLRSVRKLELWSSKYSWVKRCAAFDDDENKAISKALQNQRLKQRLQLEKDAWKQIHIKCSICEEFCYSSCICCFKCNY